MAKKKVRRRKTDQEWLTINALAQRLKTDKRTLAARLENFPSKSVGGYKCFRLRDAEQVTAIARDQAKGKKQLEEDEIRERIRARRIKNDQAEGRLTSNEVFIERLVKLAADQKQLLRQKLENELPQYLASCSEPAQARVMLKRVVDDLCGRMAALLNDWQVIVHSPSISAS